MIRFVYADQVNKYPALADSMYKDRAAQFKNRLNWEVDVDENGWEIDQYDSLNPLYMIYEDAYGRHAGSARLMPTIGRNMTAEHFRHLTDGVQISSPLIWESTRFCLAPGAGPNVTAALMASGLELGLRFGLDQGIGVIYSRTLGLYRRIGHFPEVIGDDGNGRDSISICVWNVTEEARDAICARSGIPAALVARWFDQSFNVAHPEFAAVA